MEDISVLFPLTRFGGVRINNTVTSLMDKLSAYYFTLKALVARYLLVAHV
jgi:hypothetical protein